MRFALRLAATVLTAAALLVVVPHAFAATSTDLGAVYSPASTTFGLWSPDSSSVTVTVGGASHSLSATGGGIYQAVVSGDLKDQAYQFKVRGVAVPDPYAKMVKPGT